MLSQRRAQHAQRVEEELNDRGADTRSTQETGIENEGRHDTLAAACGGIERGMIGES